MSFATITMSLPNSKRTTSATRALDGKAETVSQLADALRHFAQTRGVSVRAVDYSVTVH